MKIMVHQTSAIPISLELVKTMVVEELTKAHKMGVTIRPELSRALGLEETAEPCQIKGAIWMVEVKGLMETVEFYHTSKAIRMLKAKVVEEETKGDYTEDIITQLVEDITEMLFLGKSISKGSIRFCQRDHVQEAVRMTHPFESTVIMEYPSLGYPNLCHDGHAQPFISANDAFFVPMFSRRQTPETDFVEIMIGHDQNYYLDGSKCKNPKCFSKNHGNDCLTYSSIEPLNASFGMETNRMFVSILGQAAAGVMTSASVKNSSVLMFLYIAALVGFLGNMWAMYLQKNQMWAKWLSKIGAIGSSCGILIALSSNFAVEEYLTAYIVITAAGVLITTVLITMDN